MKRAVTIKAELDQIHTVQELTGVFESIASMKISKLRDRVVQSKVFFSDLWQTYRELRIDPNEQLKRPHRTKKNRNVFVAITSEGKLSGGVVERVGDVMMDALSTSDSTDVIILGAQGAVQFAQQGIEALESYHLPDSDGEFSVAAVVETLQQYDQISVFYQTYESLRVQRIARIELISAVRELGDAADDSQQDDEIVSSRSYVFEPNITEIADYLESLMMEVALTQIIMESKLAQYASRFNAMNTAKHRADEISKDFDRLYHRAKRGESDERIKETMKVLLRRTA